MPAACFFAVPLGWDDYGCAQFYKMHYYGSCSRAATDSSLTIDHELDIATLQSYDASESTIEHSATH